MTDVACCVWCGLQHALAFVFVSQDKAERDEAAGQGELESWERQGKLIFRN